MKPDVIYCKCALLLLSMQNTYFIRQNQIQHCINIIICKNIFLCNVPVLHLYQKTKAARISSGCTLTAMCCKGMNEEYSFNMFIVRN